MSKKLKTILYISVIPLVILVCCFGIYLMLNLDLEFVSEEKRENLIKRFRKDVENIAVSKKITKIKDTELIIPKGSISVGAKYESQLDSKEVEKEFINSLTSSGWLYYHKNSDRDFTILEFCKGKYTADFTANQSQDLNKPDKQIYSLNFRLQSPKPLFPTLPEECKR